MSYLSLTNVCKQYKTGEITVDALSEVSFELSDGEFAVVLGYFDGEVAGYIYREVYIDTVIGVLLGLPLSPAILKIVFDIMAVGTIATMSWFVWLIAPAVVLLFTAFVTPLLRRKIVKVDMNESLKAIE